MNRSNQQLPNLDKIFKDDDDQDFTPLGGSNLAAIFGTSQKIVDAPTVSQKQSSQKKSNSDRSTPQIVQAVNKTEVIIAKAVHAYKLNNGQYSLIGKLGIALTGNASSRIYQIILYKSKQEHISVVTLNSNFVYTIRENNYATYYDDVNENWSLLFETEDACIDFAREIGVSRFNSKQIKSDDTLMYQNLTVENNNEGAKEGDVIIVKTTILTNLNQPLKINGLPSQKLNIQISQDENWEKSLLNAGKGLKRLMILPPSKQISLGPSFPREKEIIMEIEVIDIFNTDEKNSGASSKTGISTGKASILSRMAKMGQSMLPKVPTSTTTDSEDTEEEVPVKSPRRFKSEISSTHSTKQQARPPQISEDTASMANTIVPRAAVPSSVPLTHRPSMVPSSGFASPWTSAPIQQQYVTTMDGQYYPIQATVTQPIPAAMDPNINVFLSETRTQNSEIRMGISKIADNVQKLLDKFHVLEVQSASSPINERAMETSLKMLMALNANNVNARFDHAANGKNSTNSENGSTDDELTKNSISKLENELRKANELLDENTKKNANHEAEKQEWSLEKIESSRRMEHLEKSLTESQIALQKSLNDLKTANSLTADYLKEKSLLEAKIFKLEAEKNILEKTVKNATSENKEIVTGNDKTTEIKQIMNKTYQTLLAKFTEESYMTEYIKQTVANTIRNITLQVLKEDKIDVEPKSRVKNEEKSSEITAVTSSRNSEDDDKNSVILPEISHSSSNVNLNNIPPAQEEPPPIPPMDMDAEGEWVS